TDAAVGKRPVILQHRIIGEVYLIRPVTDRFPGQMLHILAHHQGEGVHLQLLGQLSPDPQQLPGNRPGFSLPLFDDDQHSAVFGPVGFGVRIARFRHGATSSLSASHPSFSGSSVSHSLSTSCLAASSGGVSSKISPSTGFCSGTHDFATIVGDPLRPILLTSMSEKY